MDWNDQKYAEIWRQGWADTANRYLEAIGSPERLDLRSYARQGIDKIPTVHMGPAVSQLEKKGIQTNIGNLNRDIKAANSLMQSIRQMVRSLKGWLSGLKEKKAALLEALEQAKEPTIPELLSRYLDMRSEERTGWTSKGKLKGTVGDFNKVMEALDFLRQKEISTVESLDAYLDKVSGEILSAKTDIRKSERRIKAIDTTLSHIANHGAYKEVYKKYASIGWKTRKEKFAAEHREELDAYLAAKRFFKAHQEELPFDTKELKKEREQLSGELSEKNEGLQAVQGISAGFGGVAPSYFIGLDKWHEGSAYHPIAMKWKGKEVEGNMITYGLLPKAKGGRQELILYVVMADGKGYTYTFDVTEQVEKQKGKALVDIKLDEELPLPRIDESARSGLSITVESWRKVYLNIKM